MYYAMGEPMVSFGTGFLVAAIVTSLEVIVHAMQKKGKTMPVPKPVRPKKIVKKKTTKKKAKKKTTKKRKK